MKVREVLKVFNKLDMEIREARDTLAFFKYNGKIVLWTKVPHKKSDVKGKIQYFIRQQLKLNDNQFRDLISCKLIRNDYIEILISKGFIKE